MKIHLISQNANQIWYNVIFSYDKPIRYIEINRFNQKSHLLITKTVKTINGIIKSEVYQSQKNKYINLISFFFLFFFLFSFLLFSLFFFCFFVF